MIYWLIVLFFVLAIELYRYISYLFTRKRFNQYEPHGQINHGNVRKLFEDFERFPDTFEDNLRDLHYQRVEPENMNFHDACDSLFSLTGEDEQYRDYIKKLVKMYQLRERKKGRNVLTGTQRHQIITKKSPIRSWFTILPIYLVTRGFCKMIELYMRYLGFRYFICKNSGVKIWYNRYNKKKGVPLVFFHASVGGVSFQFTVMKHYRDFHNVIIPEIPGVSFLTVSDKPPTTGQIIDDVHDFITNHYYSTHCPTTHHSKHQKIMVNMSIFKINLMGHSLGSAMCNAYINKYPKHVDNFFCVEGMIFFHRSMRVHSDFNTRVHHMPKEDLITVPLFHRDLYVQYFIKRLKMDEVFLFDMDNDRKHIKIHMYHIKNDKRVLIQPQLEHAKRKNIKIRYHLFEGDYDHGSFVLNNVVKQYVCENIKKIYIDQNHFNLDVFGDTLLTDAQIDAPAEIMLVKGLHDKDKIEIINDIDTHVSDVKYNGSEIIKRNVTQIIASENNPSIDV